MCSKHLAVCFAMSRAFGLKRSASSQLNMPMQHWIYWKAEDGRTFPDSTHYAEMEPEGVASLWKGYVLDFAGRYVGSSTRMNTNKLFLQEMVLKHMDQSLQLHLDCTIYHVTLLQDVPTQLQLSIGFGLANNYTSATSAHWQQIPWQWKHGHALSERCGSGNRESALRTTLDRASWRGIFRHPCLVLGQRSPWSHINQAQLLWTFALSQLSLMQERKVKEYAIIKCPMHVPPSGSSPW